MEILIVLTERQANMLEQIISKSSLTAEEYAANIVKGFLQDQIKGKFKDEFNKKTDDELAVLFGEIEKPIKEK